MDGLDVVLQPGQALQGQAALVARRGVLVGRRRRRGPTGLVSLCARIGICSSQIRFFDLGHQKSSLSSIFESGLRIKRLENPLRSPAE